MAKNSPLDVSAWIRRLGLDFKDSITPYGLSCIFPYHQIRVDEPLLRAAANYWVPSRHVFSFNKIELCPIIEKFAAIMGEPKIDDFIFPSMGGDLPSLLRVLLDVPAAIANRWCVFGKLNLKLVFEYFFSSTLLEGKGPCSYSLRAFCLCALARYFLVQNLYCVDLWMCMIAYELKRGNSVGLILAETLNGLDAFHRKEANFFAGSPLLLQVCPSRHLTSSFIIILFYFLFFIFYFFRYGYKRDFSCFNLLPYSQHLPP